MTRESGFSLIEVLAATAIFALVSSLSVGLLVSALRTQSQSQLVLDDIASVQRVATLLRDDIGQITSRPVRSENGMPDGRIFAANIEGVEQIRARSGEAREILVLTRTGWTNPGLIQPRSSLQRVAWVLDEDRLYRAVWAYPDAAAGAEPVRQLLVEGVSDLDLKLLRAGVWLDAAVVMAGEEAQVSPPDAVRLSYQIPGLGRMEHVVLSPVAEPA